MSFEIVSATRQLNEIGIEIKRLTQSLKKAREIENNIKKDIGTYLESHKQQGVMIHNTTILKEEKVVSKPLKKKEKEDNLKTVLGDQATPELLERIKNASKGTKVIKKTITVHYDKLTK